MNDILHHFSKIIDYLEQVTIKNNVGLNSDDDIKEQRENLKDLKYVINKFQKSLDEFDSYESIESELTVNKLLKIHKYINDLEWHVSEMSELNTKVMKICSNKPT